MLLLWESYLSSKTLEYTTEMLRRKQEGKGRDMTGNLPAPPQKSPVQPPSLRASEFEKASKGMWTSHGKERVGRALRSDRPGFGSQALRPISSVTHGKLLLSLEFLNL